MSIFALYYLTFFYIKFKVKTSKRSHKKYQNTVLKVSKKQVYIKIHKQKHKAQKFTVFCEFFCKSSKKFT
ncbi:hypothetical protein DMC01_12480 [Campylobacter troglodytis]|nr:hypothetical protein DMC01_12480 [Campylobacter troglodytis]